MNQKKYVPFFAFACWWWLNHQGLSLAYHRDPQGIAHLAVLRHDPAKKEQLGYFLFPGEQYDIWETTPRKDETLFTLIDSEELWAKVTFTIRFVKALTGAVRHLRTDEGAKK